MSARVRCLLLIVLEGLREELTNLGYPIIGDPNTIVEKAKSYFNFAVGRISCSS